MITEPAVLGAVIDLGQCLDLLDSEYLKVIKAPYDFLRISRERYGEEIPKNSVSAGNDLLLRKLDCAVIEVTHQLNKEMGEEEYDSVRGVFFEGDDLYENASFKEKNHIQIAIRNPNCIKGYFIPRDLNADYRKP